MSGVIILFAVGIVIVNHHLETAFRAGSRSDVEGLPWQARLDNALLAIAGASHISAYGSRFVTPFIVELVSELSMIFVHPGTDHELVVLRGTRAACEVQLHPVQFPEHVLLLRLDPAVIFHLRHHQKPLLVPADAHGRFAVLLPPSGCYTLVERFDFKTVGPPISGLAIDRDVFQPGHRNPGKYLAGEVSLVLLLGVFGFVFTAPPRRQEDRMFIYLPRIGGVEVFLPVGVSVSVGIRRSVVAVRRIQFILFLPGVRHGVVIGVLFFFGSFQIGPSAAFFGVVDNSALFLSHFAHDTSIDGISFGPRRSGPGEHLFFGFSGGHGGHFWRVKAFPGFLEVTTNARILVHILAGPIRSNVSFCPYGGRIPDLKTVHLL